MIVNNDNQRELKRSKEFMLEEERKLIVSELKIVDKVFVSISFLILLLKDVVDVSL